MRLCVLVYDGRILHKGRVYNIGSQPTQVLGVRFYIKDRDGKSVGLDFNMDTVGHQYLYQDLAGYVRSTLHLYLPDTTDTYLTEDELENKIEVFDCSSETQFLRYLVDSLLMYPSEGKLSNFSSLLIGYMKSKCREDNSYIFSNIWSESYGTGNYTQAFAFDLESNGVHLYTGVRAMKDSSVRFNCIVSNLPNLGTKRAEIRFSSLKLDSMAEVKYIGNLLLNLAGMMLLVYKGVPEGKTEITAMRRAFNVYDNLIVSTVKRNEVTEVISLEL